MLLHHRQQPKWYSKSRKDLAEIPLQDRIQDITIYVLRPWSYRFHLSVLCPAGGTSSFRTHARKHHVNRRNPEQLRMKVLQKIDGGLTMISAQDRYMTQWVPKKQYSAAAATGSASLPRCLIYCPFQRSHTCKRKSRKQTAQCEGL